jgi:hypothetical protein
MKRYVEGQDRSQVTLFPESLDEYIAEGNPVIQTLRKQHALRPRCAFDESAHRTYLDFWFRPLLSIDVTKCFHTVSTQCGRLFNNDYS